MAAVEGSNAGHGMDVPAVANRDREPGNSCHFMQVQAGKISVGLENMNVVIADRNDFAGHARKAVVVRNFLEDHGAALHFVDMGLGGYNILLRSKIVAYQVNPSLAYTLRGRDSPSHNLTKTGILSCTAS